MCSYLVVLCFANIAWIPFFVEYRRLTPEGKT